MLKSILGGPFICAETVKEVMFFLRRRFHGKGVKYKNFHFVREQKVKKQLTLLANYDNILFAFEKRMRKCRNWQTSKTKDLVSNALVWVQVPSSAFAF